MNRNTLQTLKGLLDYLGGSREELRDAGLPVWLERVLHSGLFRGVWWIFLVAVVLFFSGQTSKFIYIDF